ncbi:hypothetical protein MRX96_036361 [Rhipicephalus microplus]
MSSTDAASSAAGANAGSETLQTQPAKKKTAGDLVKEVEAQGTEEPDDGGGDMEDDLDDDELLGLGNDFNILEYADPELDRAFVGEGEKSNILDEHLDLDDKEDDLDEVGRQETDTKDDDAAMPQGASLLSDVDFERLKADVLSGPPDDSIGAPAPVMPQAALLPAMPQQHPVNPGQLVGNPGQRYLQMQGGPAGWPTSGMVAGPAQAGGPHLMRQLPVGPGGPMVSPGGTMHLVRTEQGAIRVMGGPPPHRPPDQLGHVGTHAGVAGGGGALVSPGDGGAAQVPFQIQTLPAPPTPSLCIGQDPPPGAMVAAYEQWLAQQDALLSSQKKTLEGEVGKLRKAKKALSTKQRQLAKTGQELPQQNALELQRIAQQQPGMQKNLDQLRKLSGGPPMVSSAGPTMGPSMSPSMSPAMSPVMSSAMSPMVSGTSHQHAVSVSTGAGGMACGPPSIPHATALFPNGRPLPFPKDAAATNVPYGLSPPPDVATAAFTSHPKATRPLNAAG